MSFRKKHWVLGASILAATGLIAGCGGGSDDEMEPETVATPTTPTTPTTPPPMVPEPTPTGMIDGIPQTTGLYAMLGAALPDLMGEGGTFMKDHPIEAGMPWEVGGVRFMCAADADCVVKLTLTRDEDGNVTNISADYEGGAVTAEFIDPAGNMNDANADSLAAIIARGNSELTDVLTNNNMDPDTPALTISGFDVGRHTGRADNPTTPGDETMAGRPPGIHWSTNTVQGLTSSDATPGIGSAGLGEFTLHGNLDPNGPQFTEDDTTNTPNVDETVLGSMMTVKVDEMTGDTDDIGMTMAGAVGIDGWSHRVLHSDWGDTRTPGRDGGFETLAAVYTDMEEPTMVPFADVRKMVANASWFTLGSVSGTLTIDVSGDASPASAIRITVEDPTLATLAIKVEPGTAVKGTYYGAPGTFTCVGEGTPTQCHLARAMTQQTSFRVADVNNSALPVADRVGFGEAGDWTFKPDPGAMVALPDQDWVAFGYWVTAPDDPVNGAHRLGVFYQGMEAYDYSMVRVIGDAEYTTTTNMGLRGTATYSGAAAGYYVDGMDDGVFTADATLTATFNDGVRNTTPDHRLSGRIDNFRGSDGSYLSADNPDDPNDPNRGGEGDWYVNLSSTPIHGDEASDTAQEATFGSVGVKDGEGVENASGTADGVSWSGAWHAQLYGPGHRATGAKVPPSGVAGAFRAVSSKLEGGGYRGVVGTFGAQMTSATGP